MQIAYHIGANCTDEDRLLKTILRNGPLLAEHGAKAPGPGKYRSLIRQTIQTLNDAPPEPDARQVLLDAVLDAESCDRLIMSNANFICIPNRIFDHGVFYEQTAFKLRGLAALFPGDEISLFLGLRDPATFLPAAFAESKADTFDAFLQGTLLGDIRWSDVVQRMRDTLPDAQLTVWCNEETPFLWGEIVGQICGFPQNTAMEGEFDLLSTILSDTGLTRMRGYLEKHPPKTAAQKRKIIMAFLDKYALPDAVEETIDIPQLDAGTLAALSEAYDADVALIAQMPGVTFIEP